MTPTDILANPYFQLSLATVGVIGCLLGMFQTYMYFRDRERVSFAYNTLSQQIFDAERYRSTVDLFVSTESCPDQHFKKMTITTLLLYNSGNKELESSSFASFPLAIVSKNSRGKFIKAELNDVDEPESRVELQCLSDRILVSFVFIRRKTAFLIDVVHTFPGDSILLLCNLKSAGFVYRIGTKVSRWFLIFYVIMIPVVGVLVEPEILLINKYFILLPIVVMLTLLISVICPTYPVAEKQGRSQI